MSLLTLALGILALITVVGTLLSVLDYELGFAFGVGIVAAILVQATVMSHNYDGMEAALASKDARYEQLETSAAKMGNLLASKNTELNKAYARITAYEGQISNIRTQLSWSNTNLKKCEAKQQESTGSIDEIRAILEN